MGGGDKSDPGTGEFMGKEGELFHRFGPSPCILLSARWVRLSHADAPAQIHKPQGTNSIADWITAACGPASADGCNNGVVVPGSIVSGAGNKQLVKAGCVSMLMRLRANAC